MPGSPYLPEGCTQDDLDRYINGYDPTDEEDFLDRYTADEISLFMMTEPPDRDELDDPFRTCEYGHHVYRYAGGGDENPQYRCEDCGSTDAEGEARIGGA
jgi:hypothetical protein